MPITTMYVKNAVRNLNENGHWSDICYAIMTISQSRAINALTDVGGSKIWYSIPAPCIRVKFAGRVMKKS